MLVVSLTTFRYLHGFWGRGDGPARLRKGLGTQPCGAPGSEAVEDHMV